MTTNEYFALKTQIKQKWFEVIFYMIVLTALATITSATINDQIIETTANQSPNLIRSSMKILMICISLYTGIRGLKIVIKENKLDKLYKENCDFEEAATKLSLIQKKNEKKIIIP